MPLATVSIKPFNILGYSNKEAGQGVLGGESRVESNEKEKRRCVFFFLKKKCCVKMKNTVIDITWAIQPGLKPQPPT